MDEVIVLNECRNDGTHIYLYEDHRTDLWSAYGYSAYKVNTLAVDNHLPLLKSFSREYQMPLVMFDKKTCEALQQLCRHENTTSQGLCLVQPEPVDDESYYLWVNHLRIY